MRACSAFHDLNFNLMEQLGLLTALASKDAVNALETFVADRAVDLGKVGSLGRQHDAVPLCGLLRFAS